MTTTAPANSTKRCYYGVAEGVVADVNDPEKEGRVKLLLPWFDENTTSDWCRVSQLYAGNGYGSFWCPELRDEVLVAFIHGDIRQPIVLGGLYNGVDKPPTHRSDKGEIKDEKVFRTKAGHEIRFVDTSGEERITIVDKSKKHRIEISTKDNAITIKSDGGKMTLAAKEIEILADDSLKIEAKTIAEKASTSLKTEAGKIDATASGQMTLKGSTINLN